MPKILWVALPLLAALAWLAWRLLRRRSPTRRGLNVAASLVLLCYVLATAGLGIFWVAKQQLPVFDWHYLFGYATLLLLVLHLVFNWRVVWRTLTRPAAEPPAGPAEAPRRRRRVFGLAAALAALGAAYWAGWRNGRAQAVPVAETAAPDSQMAAVERFHALSSHRRGEMRAPGLDWGQAPPPFKHMADAVRIDLQPAAGPDLQALATLLWSGAGITATRGTLKLRAAPSSGALFPTELYVAARAWPGVPRGLWHYDPLTPGLQRLDRPEGAVREVAAAGGESGLGDASAILVATAVFARSGHKYGDRTMRYVLADLGHVLENLRVAARAIGLPMRLAPVFDEARCAAALGLDEAQEGVLAWIAIGGGGAVVDGSAPPANDPLRLIAQRRSVRRFSAVPLAREDLAAVLAELAAPQPQALTQALRIHVVAHAVSGLASGSWRYDVQRQALDPGRTGGGDWRARSRAAALDQDVIGDAQAVLVLGVDREALRADALGALRSYRHALLQAGLVGERVYLAAGSRGLAVCAVGAFYDDEAAALVGIDPAREWVLHFAALGVPG